MPTLLKNNTSPFARIAHAALIDAAAPDLSICIADQWNDDPALLAVNSAGRVPCLVLDDGTAIAECLLIARHADNVGEAPAPGNDAPRILSIAGLALGVCDAAVQTLVGRKIVSGDFADTAFDASPIGRKRRRTMVDGLAELGARIDGAPGERLDLATIAAVTALDYVALRFPDADWVPDTPRLKALRAATAGRPAFCDTRPFL
ncbi:glutathione S-transferase N-terminal domain-containing protein [Aurantimonas coralicida]|uniref:glutathione S-transferase N-terminal domain-containing protein n=1 Tax=Aurantimonas coralicida TaxID=182270 RepID=UPI001D1938A6|nr:glutathione S-transferase N-terminal domain-containing protein [Aurantimonas coralicida]MCC4296864.1 glutathione S-transferase N-terminal domain-containing protein [Aurantimonas coralicida]